MLAHASQNLHHLLPTLHRMHPLSNLNLSAKLSPLHNPTNDVKLFIKNYIPSRKTALGISFIVPADAKLLAQNSSSNSKTQRPQILVTKHALSPKDSVKFLASISPTPSLLSSRHPPSSSSSLSQLALAYEQINSTLKPPSSIPKSIRLYSLSNRLLPSILTAKTTYFSSTKPCTACDSHHFSGPTISKRSFSI